MLTKLREKTLRFFGIHKNIKYTYLFPNKNFDPVCARIGTSDLDVYDQVFKLQEYSAVIDIPNPRLIIDCGANVGYASIYFMNLFPQAYIVLIEPNKSNVQMCQKNLANYNSSRYRIYHSAVWTHSTDLVITQGTDNKDWSFQVREKRPEEQRDVAAHNILYFLEKSNFQEIDLLKIDIERSETIIFSQNYESWLNKTHNLIIELHDEECERIFFKALEGYDYQLQKFSEDPDDPEASETTFCKNINRKIG